MTFYQEFERLGGTKTTKVDVRLVAATNRDLSRMVAEREFRSDLFYSLAVFPMSMPPLRPNSKNRHRLLAALVPPPRFNLVLYHGVFAPNVRLRPRSLSTPWSGSPPFRAERTPHARRRGKARSRVRTRPVGHAGSGAGASANSSALTSDNWK